ncbi:hypothetical protein FH608_018150 [Nonomuraea phyllanthi]|uniref:Uncharacterized protein n=1 Tax=Nonomuraea phyllanthi TaxID=2219224 RepID=A0A5C4WJV9_9ACTN|nr:hypothetical protein [Nonomuraea phyllanthi]KAB8194102.1 hypothetical protein FH608_018150 [Nonomuraea phyllanthi]QFY07704.1 hypothetical protein GBF35_14315 [Nonomuraea phyllanthi]
MTTPNGEEETLYELEVEVEVELTRARASHAEEDPNLPVTDWLFDPTDAEREEVGLRGLLDAVEVLEEDVRRGDRDTDAGRE